MHKPDDSPSPGKTTFINFTREQKLIFWSLSFSFISKYCTETIIAPTLPLEGAKHGVSSSVIGMIFSVYDLMAVFSSPFIGVLIAKIGPKKVIISGIGLYGTFMILFGWLENVESYTWFVTGCFTCLGVSSFGGAAIYTATLTYATKMFPENISLVVGITETYSSIGEVVALLSGGVLQDIGGYKFPFIIFGTLNLLAVPLDLLLIPSDDDDDEKVENESKQSSSGFGETTWIWRIKDVKNASPRLNLRESISATSKTTSKEYIPISSQVSFKKLLYSEEFKRGEVETLKNRKEIPEHLRLWHLAAIPKTVLMTLILFVVGISWSFVVTTLEPHLEPLNMTKTEINLMFLLTSIVYGVSSPLSGWVAGVMKKQAWILMVTGLIFSGITFGFLGPLPFLGLRNTVWLNIVCLTVITVTLAAAWIPACEAMVLYTIEAGYKDNLETYAIVSSLISTSYHAGAACGAFAGGFLLDNLGYASSAGICGNLCILWGAIVLVYFVSDGYRCPDKRAAFRKP